MNQEQENAFLKEAHSWLGTPWIHMQAVKGVGVYCIQFIIAVAKTMGWFPKTFKSLKYTRQWALHSSTSVLIEELAKYCTPIPSTNMQVGDVLIYHVGKCESHAGFYIGEDLMIHSHLIDGVSKDRIDSPEYELTSVWRIKSE